MCEVLYAHRAGDAPGFEDDDGRPWRYLAARPEPNADVVGTLAVNWVELPDGLGPGMGWRLRGVAVEPAWRKRGVGRALVDHAASAARSGDVVWVNARIGARRFYERLGFDAYGDYWDDPASGAHVVMARRA